MENKTLSNLIEAYATYKEIESNAKKSCDSYNSQIKAEMNSAKLSDFDTGEYTAVLSTVSKESIDEDLLVEYAKTLGIRGIVKKKEYVDMDMLEKAIYAGKITQEQLMEIGKCKIIKSYQKLVVKKNKKKKEA